MQAVDFDKVVAAAGRTAKYTRRGERDGGNRTIYFPNKTWDELRRRCDERGISISRYLQTLAVLTLKK